MDDFDLSSRPSHLNQAGGLTQNQIMALVLAILAGGIFLNWLVGGG